MRDFLISQRNPSETFCLESPRTKFGRKELDSTAATKSKFKFILFLGLFYFLFLFLTTVGRCHAKLKLKCKNINYIGTKLKAKLNVENELTLIQCLDKLLEILKRNKWLNILEHKNPDYSFLCCFLISGLAPDDPLLDEVAETVGLGLEAPGRHSEAASLGEGVVTPKAGVGVPLVPNVPDVHGPVKTVVSLGAGGPAGVEGDHVLVILDRRSDGKLIVRCRVEKLGRGGLRANDSDWTVIGHRCASLTGGERDRPVHPDETSVQCCTETQLNSSVHSPVQWAWPREFPEEAEHCFEDVINGTPGSGLVTRGLGRPGGLAKTIAEGASLCPANTIQGEAKSVQKSPEMGCRQCRLQEAGDLVLLRIYDGLGSRPE